MLVAVGSGGGGDGRTFDNFLERAQLVQSDWCEPFLQTRFGGCWCNNIIIIRAQVKREGEGDCSIADSGSSGKTAAAVVVVDSEREKKNMRAKVKCSPQQNTPHHTTH